MNRKPTYVLLAACFAAGCGDSGSDGAAGGPTIKEPEVLADLRADSNRDGKIRFDDDSDAERLVWNDKTGAVFLANIDDDLGACKRVRGDDLKMAECNDAADDVVNGPDDALDLARLATKPWPEADPDTTAQIVLEPESAWKYVRLFRKTGPEAVDFTAFAEGETSLSRGEIEAGVELAIEGRDIVRDPATWDGYVNVKLLVTNAKGNAESTVRMRVAPVITFHHLLDAEEIFISRTGSPGNTDTRRDLAAACSQLGAPTPTEIPENDPWAQDFFETGYMSMPGADGKQHAMRVNYRSANVFAPKSQKAPLRPAGAIVFDLRGKDVAGVQQFDVKHEQSMDSLNSFGNFETIPPYTMAGGQYPLGRVLRGRTASFYPDKTFTKLVSAQAVQPAVDIDTSWLLVGHVDETLSFTHAKNARGWVLLANDPRLARQMLEAEAAAGRGDVPMFVDKMNYDWETNAEVSAQTTIAEVLANTEVMSASATAAAEVDAQVAILKKELGLADDEIVRIPFLHVEYGGVSVAFQPGLVNGIYVGKNAFAAPKPHGPSISGVDIFEKAMTDALAPHGVAVKFVEDWEYHAGGGEVHCGTNAARAIPETKWWETGR